ncbi:transglutaminase domain-containing protein [Myxococcota bacterium]|nr:transglutaminase domain-containing protein [Myxococcota bacterium]
MDAPSTPPRINRLDEAQPDMATDQSDSPRYGVIFEPSIAPLRRDTAFGVVLADERLILSGGEVAVPVGPPPTATEERGRARFRARLTLRFQRHRPQPLPSVSPDMRVLIAEADPPTRLRFTRDGDDNFSVYADHTGLITLRLLVDADRAYFEPPLAGNVALSINAAHPAAQLPPEIAVAAVEVLDALEVRPDDPFDRGLARLTAWFGAFEVAPSSEAEVGARYRALALNQRGVCRHRAFAFALTARAAGVPTRVVYNEVHAFVEVLAPDHRWRRVDLGGAPLNLEIHGGEAPSPASPTASPTTSPTASPTASPTGGGAVTLQPESGPFGAAAEVEIPARGHRTSGERARAVVVTLDLPSLATSALRGAALDAPLTGVVRDADSQIPLEGVRVQVFLMAPELPPLPLGASSSTNAQGRYHIMAKIPASTPLGRYQIIAVTAPQPGHDAARSDARPDVD